MKSGFYIFPILVLLFAGIVFGQENSECKDITYTDKNQVAPKFLILENLSGLVVNQHEEPFDSGCVVLFRDDDRSKVSETITDENGEFSFKNIPDGRYRLVVRHEYGYYCPANIPIEIKRGSSKKRSLKVVMRPEEVDLCSSWNLET